MKPPTTPTNSEQTATAIRQWCNEFAPVMSPSQVDSLVEAATGDYRDGKETFEPTTPTKAPGFTPGPLLAKFRKDMSCGFDPSVLPWSQSWNGPDCLIVDANGRPLAAIYGPSGNNADMTKAMNANLMANAPLLWKRNEALSKALEKLAIAIENDSVEPSRLAIAALDNARAVLAAVEGGGQ